MRRGVSRLRRRRRRGGVRSEVLAGETVIWAHHKALVATFQSLRSYWLIFAVANDNGAGKDWTDGRMNFQGCSVDFVPIALRSAESYHEYMNI